MGKTFEEWWREQGEITRYAGLYILAVSTGVTVGVISPAYFAVYLDGPTGWLQLLYRPVLSSMFFGAFSMQWIMTVPTFISFLSQNEKGSFVGKPVDFIWMLLFLAYTTGALALAVGFPWTYFSMLLGLCWVHCKRNPGDRSALFGFEFRSAYFPWVLVAFNFIISQTLLPGLVGIAAGHTYVFLQDVLPTTHGRRLLDTPEWFHKVMARLGVFNHQVRFGGFQPEAQPQRPQERPGGHAWGRGRALGGG